MLNGGNACEEQRKISALTVGYQAVNAANADRSKHSSVSTWGQIWKCHTPPNGGPTVPKVFSQQSLSYNYSKTSKKNDYNENTSYFPSGETA